MIDCVRLFVCRCESFGLEAVGEEGKAGWDGPRWRQSGRWQMADGLAEDHRGKELI